MGLRENEKGGRERVALSQSVKEILLQRKEGKVAKGACMIKNFFLTQRLLWMLNGITHIIE